MKFINGCKTAISQYEGCSFCPYSLYLLGVKQQVAPQQQQQTMMTGTDTRMTNRMSNAITIPATAPGVRPANRKHACVKNALPKRLNMIASLGGYGQQAVTYTKADSGTHTKADSGTHTKADSGTHTKADSGTHTKTYSGTHTHTHTHTHTRART